MDWIKELVSCLQAYLIWLLLLVLTDGLFGLLLWLLNPDAFAVIFGVMILGSMVLFLAALFWALMENHKKKHSFLEFLENPDVLREQKACQVWKGFGEHEMHVLGSKLREAAQRYNRLSEQLEEYEEYVESWAHEVKTPLALMTILMDNRREEMTPDVYERMEYARSRMQEQVNRMLFFARLKAVHKDYLFEPVSLPDCIFEVLEEYEGLLGEQGFDVRNEVPELTVVSDQRSLIFLISQIVSNAIKYKKGAEIIPLLLFTACETKTKPSYMELHIIDNGIGVKAYDLPFLFEKGYTGDTGKQGKKATGMGLYLAQRMADELNVTLDAKSVEGEGFEMIVRFPIISRFPA